MKKTAIIIGGVTLIGVVAYFYFKPKLSASTGTGTGTGMGTGTGTGTTGTTGTGTTMPPAGTVLTTPEQVEAITIKISTARDLTKTICDLKKKFKITEDQMNDFMNFTSVTFGSDIYGISPQANTAFTFATAKKKAIQLVAQNIKKLQELGYKEDGCKMVQIA